MGSVNRLVWLTFHLGALHQPDLCWHRGRGNEIPLLSSLTSNDGLDLYGLFKKENDSFPKQHMES